MAANLVHELGLLARIPRSGLSFLGSGRQSVAEHSHRMACIALILARRCDQPVDEAGLLRLCLFHDLPEARTGDQNYVNRKYVRVDEDRLLADIEAASSLGPELRATIEEFERGASLEARLARDADQIELLALLREEADLGNPRAGAWIASCRQRVVTAAGQSLADEVLATPADEWWFGDKGDAHWVTASDTD
ncbi:MAG: HD domain-containing protein [Armatimonadetes bacterium]|nr:HD domain-containing protein [Armatimonadota bacterium]